MSSKYKYWEYRHQARTGDVVIFKGNNPLAWGIQAIAGEGSHTATIVREKKSNFTERILLFESTIGGVRCRPASNRLIGNNWAILQDQIDRGEKEINRLYDAWDERKGYDYFGLFITEPLWILSGGKLFAKQPGVSLDGKFWCSEFQAWSKYMDGWETMTPNKLYHHKELLRIINFD